MSLVPAFRGSGFGIVASDGPKHSLRTQAISLRNLVSVMAILQ